MAIQKQLVKAIAYLTAGTGMVIGSVSQASASSIYYNTYSAYSANIVSDFNNGYRDGMTAGSTFAGWTSPSSAMPFGFDNERLHWAAEISSGGDSLTVSSQDAHDRYGIWADIDTAKGAWSDGDNGWEHQIDVGLIRSDVDTDVTINITGLEAPGQVGVWHDFGVSIYSGMPGGVWLAHGTWNCGVSYAGCLDGSDTYQVDNPLSASGLSYITHDATVDALNGITFHATAGTVYTVLLGGSSGGSVFGPKEGYALNITTVPIPGALWLFGSALAGLIAASRNRTRPL